jgi:nucleotide-binding universal stress UspA family protein
MYQRILVTTGGSPWSHAAVTYAIALAARTDAELRILTVITSEADTGRVDRPESAEPALTSMEQKGEELLIHAAAHATRARVVYTTHAARGSIPAMIQQAAVDEECDLIIMGARQATGVHRPTLGSIVNAVAAQTPQPVLVIKASSELAEPFGQRLLVATGGSAWSEAAVDHAVRLAETFQLPLNVLHVAAESPGQGAGRSAAGGNPLLSKATEQAATHGIAVEGTLASGDIPEAILAAATSAPCSAIVLGTRGVTGWSRPRLGAIVNAVAARTPLPVLIVKHFVSASTN